MLNKKKLLHLVESKGADSAAVHLIEGLRTKVFAPTDFSIKDLAECLITNRDGSPVGRSWVESLGPQKSGGLTLLEASSAVDLSRFSNITGQIFYNRIMQAYQQDEFVGTNLVDSYQTDLNGEKVPGMTGFTQSTDDADDDLQEGEEYKQIGFGEDYIETPATKKSGRIVSISKETIFFDRTQLVLKQAGSVGEYLARRKERKILGLILGITNSYKWRGTTYNTYQTATPWINVKSGVDSAVTAFDWTKIDSVEQLFADMLDPNTGEPIIIGTPTILAMPARKHVMRRVLTATRHEVRTQSSVIVSDGANTLDNYNLVTSRRAYRRLIDSGVAASDAAAYWYMGDFKKAFAWQYNWPLTVLQAPSNSEPEFTQDIVLRWKASERGSPVVLDPRYVVKVYNA